MAKNIPEVERIPYGKRTSNRWLDTQKEFSRWKKTANFVRWRHRQFLLQGGTCYYCDEPLGGVKINTEHVIPKSRGGNNLPINLVLACSDCNKNKGTKLLTKKARSKLKAKNKIKRGTYHLLKEKYPTENDLALQLKARLAKLPGDTWPAGIFNDELSDAGEIAQSVGRLEKVAPDEIRSDVATIEAIYKKIYDDPSQAISASLSGLSAESSVKKWTADHCSVTN